MSVRERLTAVVEVEGVLGQAALAAGGWSAATAVARSPASGPGDGDTEGWS